MIWHTIQIESA